MSSRPKPTIEALERIKAIGNKEFVAFLDQVSPEATQALMGHLPPVDGFRKTSKSGIQLRKRALSKEFTSNRLSSAPNRAQADKALYLFWRAWASEQMADAAEMGAFLDSIEATVDSGKAEFPQSAVPVERVEELFSLLRKMSFEDKCSREQIERFFLFSPFDGSLAIQRLIEGAKSAANVDRDLALSALPQRLKQDEEEIKALEGRLRSLVSRLDSSTSEMQTLRNDIDTARSEQETHVNRSAKNRQSIDQLSERMKALEVGIEVQNAALKAHSRTNGEQLQALADELRRETKAQDVAQSTAAIEDLLLGLEHRVGVIEDRQNQTFDTDSLAVDLKTPKEEANRATVPTIRPRSLSSKAKSKDCGTILQLAETLALNLEAIGIKKSAAQIFADEVCATAFAGQIVFLKGAMASEAARICAFTLGGSHSWRLALPLGLIDQEALSEALSTVLPTDREFVPAIAIEGINKVALDIVSDALMDAVRGEIVPGGEMGLPLFVFASLTNGVAGLPVEVGNLSLGPIFDLDQIEWRLRRHGKSLVGSAQISSAACRSIRAELNATNVDSDELMRLLRRFQRRRNPQIETIAVAALTVLASISGRRKVPSPLQSVAFGWLLPLWIIAGLSKSDIDSEIDGGKCDNTDPDERLVNLLASDDFIGEGHRL